jgi:aminopeptidase 2
MCRGVHAGAEVEGAGIDVSKGREILPANVIPKHYDLTLEPDFKKHTYDGTVIIDLDVVEDTTSISLNSLEIEIHSTKVISGSETIRSVIDQEMGPPRVFLVLSNMHQLLSRCFLQ